MFILDMPINPAGCQGVPCLDHVENENQPPKQKSSTQGTDSLGRANKQTPFTQVNPSTQQDLNSKLLSSGLSEENMDLNRLTPNSKTMSGVPLEEYLNSNRYVFKFEDGRGRSGAPVANDQFLKWYKEQEEMQKIFEERLKAIFLGTKEEQEHRQIFNAMMFGACSPKAAIASLANILASVTFASSKQLAGQAINDIADFAARWARNVIKNNPQLAQMMKEISSILKGIIVDCLQSTQGCDSTSPSTTSYDGCGGHDAPHIQASPVAHQTGHTHHVTHTHEPTTTTYDEHTEPAPAHEDATSNNSAITTTEHTHNEHEEPTSCDGTSTEGCQDEATTTETASESGTEHDHVDEGNVEGGSVKVYDKYTGECVDDIPIVYYDYYEDDCNASCAVVPEVNNDVGNAEGVVRGTTNVLNQKVEEVKIEKKAVQVAGEELQVVDNKISNLLSGKDINKNQLASLLGQKEVLTRRIASA